jgi:hypothetical protein
MDKRKKEITKWTKKKRNATKRLLDKLGIVG